MGMTFSRYEQLIVVVFVVWRITHMLVAEDGPGFVFARLRAAVSGSALGPVFQCFYCLSIWVAALLVWVVDAKTLLERALLWLGLSGAACLLERIGPASAPPTVFYEGTREDAHELLRRSARGDDRGAHN